MDVLLSLIRSVFALISLAFLFGCGLSSLGPLKPGEATPSSPLGPNRVLDVEGVLLPPEKLLATVPLTGVGYIPLTVHESKGFWVGNAYPIQPDGASCKRALEAQHAINMANANGRRLHYVFYCVQTTNGSIGETVTVISLL